MTKVNDMVHICLQKETRCLRGAARLGGEETQVATPGVGRTTKELTR